MQFNGISPEFAKIYTPNKSSQQYNDRLETCRRFDVLLLFDDDILVRTQYSICAGTRDQPPYSSSVPWLRSVARAGKAKRKGS